MSLTHEDKKWLVKLALVTAHVILTPLAKESSMRRLRPLFRVMFSTPPEESTPHQKGE